MLCVKYFKHNNIELGVRLFASMNVIFILLRISNCASLKWKLPRRESRFMSLYF